MDSMNQHRFGKGEVLLICCIIFQLIICLMPFHYGDGYLRDELYQIALSNHLAWGYVDVPPLCPFLLAMVRSILGTSLFSIHLLPAILGAIIIFLTYGMVKIFGGDFFALAFALIPITFTSCLYGSIFCYDTFGYLFWTIMIFCLVKLLETENKNYWICFGLTAGFALLAKISVIFLGAGITIALLLTKERKCFGQIKFWMAGIIALLIFSPYVIWNAYNGFPTLEFFHNYASGKLIPISLIHFIKAQMIAFLLPVFLVWVLGLYYFLFHHNGKRYRVLGIAYIAFFLLCFFMNTRPNLVWQFYPVLLAGGGVMLSIVLKNRKLTWLKWAYLIFIFVACAYALPSYRPILPLRTYIKCYGTKGKNTLEVEKFKIGILPPILADRFGWKGLAQKVAKAYNSLPPNIRSETAILTLNYGEAGAISLFGKQYGLPEPISTHNQYYLWGPRNYTGNSIIKITVNPHAIQSPKNLAWLQVYENTFIHRKLLDRTNNKYCQPAENNAPIWLCESKKPLKEVWRHLKLYR